MQDAIDAHVPRKENSANAPNCTIVKWAFWSVRLRIMNGFLVNAVLSANEKVSYLHSFLNPRFACVPWVLVCVQSLCRDARFSCYLFLSSVSALARFWIFSFINSQNGKKIKNSVYSVYYTCTRCVCNNGISLLMRSKLTNCFLSFKYWSYWFTGCTDDRKVGEKWERIKSMTGQNKGICSLCECLADGEEFCRDSRFICFDLPGCLETEIKPDFCCPQCSKYYQRDDNEINAWNKRKRGRKMTHSKNIWIITTCSS